MNGDFLTTAFKRLRSKLRKTGIPDEDSDDALQDAFCRLWSDRDSISDDRQAEGLLAVTSRHIRIDMYRKKALHPSVGLLEIEENDKQDSPQDGVQELYRKVEALVAEVLSERDRQILYLRERDGWEFKELSQRFGLSESNIRMIVSRARKRIREVYREQNKKK